MGTAYANHHLTINCTSVGIGVPDNADNFSIHPDPVSDVLTVAVNNEKLSPVKISIQNLLGVRVYSVNVDRLAKERSMKIDVSSIANGLYFLKVETTKGTFVKRFLKN